MWLTKRFKYDIFIHIFVLVTHDNVLLKAKLHDYTKTKHCQTTSTVN